MRIKTLARFLLIVLFSCGCTMLPLSSLPFSSSQSATLNLPISEIYTVRPDILAIEFTLGEVTRGEQIPYQPQAEDQLIEERGVTWLKRQGAVLGALVGQDHDILYQFSQYSQPLIDEAGLAKPQRYMIQSQRDRNYAGGVQPAAIFLKTKPIDMVQVDRGEFVFPKHHTLYLRLQTPLTVGETYQVSLLNLRTEEIVFEYQPHLIHSEAVHVSHFGFRPDDPAKIGFLSTWMGSVGGLGYAEGTKFWLQTVDEHSEVYSGLTYLETINSELEDPYRNYNGTDIYGMDFSDFEEPGDYELCVEGVGCSFPFKVADDIWQEPFYVSARGFYHQRSGIALEPPYTDYYRPQPFHSEVGTQVLQSKVQLMDTNMGLNLKRLKVFQALAENRTDRPVPNAWGGYMDAGDWDRRIQHLKVARMMLELMVLFPETFTPLTLNIPESDNNLPDLVDEALWGIDFIKRLQRADGGIRGGIESAGHPKFGEASWQESHTVFAYAPDIWCSYIYAGVASRAAHWLQQSDRNLAADYQESALKAMQYAESIYNEQDQSDDFFYKIKDERNLAALELWRLTNDEKWHLLFLDTTAFQDPKSSVFQHKKYDQRDAAFLYTQLSLPGIKPEIKNNAKYALIQDADKLMELQDKAAFKWGKNNPHSPVVWGEALGTPHSIAFFHAHQLTNDVKYLKAAVLAVQFSSGANPDNMTYTTGLGHRSPKHPLIVDQRITNQDPPPGITVYGPSDLGRFSNDVFIKNHAQVANPPMLAWPPVESYFDVYRFVPVNEFTIQQTMTPTMYAWGYLGARK